MRALWMLSCFALAACEPALQKEPDHCGPEAPSAETQANEGGAIRTEKPGAPVKVEGELSTSNAAVVVAFEDDASDVTVEVWGVDGLVVTSAATPIQNRRLAKGERLEVPVSFTAPATRADLAVRVRGTFSGRVRERVRSFTVNAGAPPATQAPGEVKTGADGKPVRVLKAE